MSSNERKRIIISADPQPFRPSPSEFISRTAERHFRQVSREQAHIGAGAVAALANARATSEFLDMQDEHFKAAFNTILARLDALERENQNLQAEIKQLTDAAGELDRAAETAMLRARDHAEGGAEYPHPAGGESVTYLTFQKAGGTSFTPIISEDCSLVCTACKRELTSGVEHRCSGYAGESSDGEGGLR